MKTKSKKLSTGVKIELEHTKDSKLKQIMRHAIKAKEPKRTTDVKVAKKISGDHKKEHPKYYDKKVGLPAMEKRLTKAEKKKK